MASYHYARKVTDSLRSKNIKFVSQAENAPNVPQARGIEESWSICKHKMGSFIGHPKSVYQFHQQWGKVSQSVASNHGKAIMDKTLRTIRLLGRKGVCQTLLDAHKN